MLSYRCPAGVDEGDGDAVTSVSVLLVDGADAKPYSLAWLSHEDTSPDHPILGTARSRMGV